MLSIFHVFCDRRTSGAVLFAQIWNLSRDFDVPLANSKTSLCQLDNKLTRLVIIIVVICTRVWMYIAIMDEKFQRRNYWIINVDILFTVYFTAAEKTLLFWRPLIQDTGQWSTHRAYPQREFQRQTSNWLTTWIPLNLSGIRSHRLKSFERMLSDYLGKNWGYGCVVTNPP